MKITDLKFYDNIEGISIDEYRYWKNVFNKLLKLGIELEFNLKIKQGDCRGFKIDCICKYYNECSPIPCIYLNEDDTCSLYIEDISNCEHIGKKECNKECHKCKHVAPAKCKKEVCPTYIPCCVDCARNTVDCLSCEEYINNRVDPNIVRNKVGHQLKATNNFGYVGETGVLQVVGDGSLVNRGLEIPTVGRRYDFDTFRNMFATIIDKATKAGGYLDSRCSVHVHMLTEYYTKLSNDGGRRRHPDEGKHLDISGLERPFPNIFLYNLIQLWRKYEIALFWMGMGLSDVNHMTRWTKFRYPLLEFNPLNGLDTILSSIANQVGNSRYASLNLKNTQFSGKRFHVEVRIMDFVKSPTYISAMCALYKAILIKAIDVSVFGILDVESTTDIKNEQFLMSCLANGHDKGYDSNRLSNTEAALKYQDAYIRRSYELLDIVAPLLGTNEFTVLKAIADSPPAMHFIRSDKKDPENTFDIEGVYARYLPNETVDSNMDKLRRVIALGVISSKSESDWVREIAGEYFNNVSKDTLQGYITQLVRNNVVVWDSLAGTYKYI